MGWRSHLHAAADGIGGRFSKISTNRKLAVPRIGITGGALPF